MTHTRQRTLNLIVVFILLLLLFLSSCHGQIDCNSPPTRSCAFYDTCLEAKYHCGPKGYPIGFGKKFCDIFENQLTLDVQKYSPQGQDYLWKYMHNLQVSLVAPLIQNKSSPVDCRAVKQIALGTHSSCAIQSGFCKIPFKDKVRIAKTIVENDISDVFLNFVNEVLDTLFTCMF